MVQDATGMWTTPPLPADRTAGGLGPGELPQARSVTPPGVPPWAQETTTGPSRREAEHATGHLLDTVA